MGERNVLLLRVPGSARDNDTKCALLVLGRCWLLEMPRGRTDSSSSRIWIPTLGFLTGPLIAVAFWAVHVLLVSPDYYILTSNSFVDLPRVLSVGILVGVVAALALSIACNSRDPTVH